MQPNATERLGDDADVQSGHPIPGEGGEPTEYLDPQYLIPEDTISHPFRLVSSTAVSYIGYDEPTGMLYVCLIATGIEPFKYPNVSLETYLRFMESPSKGKFYNAEIRTLPTSN